VYWKREREYPNGLPDANIRGVQLQASIAKQPARDKFHQLRAKSFAVSV